MLISSSPLVVVVVLLRMLSMLTSFTCVYHYVIITMMLGCEI